MKESDFEQLMQLLSQLSPGRVPLDMQPELAHRLANCWHLFAGSDDEAMEAHKLQRMEEPEWRPPVLSFIIERHGATAVGSSRAELQVWYVDVNRRVATAGQRGYRQLYPKSPSLDVKPIADELAKLIVSGNKDDRLQWSRNGHVRVLSGRIFPLYGVPKQTLEGRKSRLVRAMEERLALYGWERRSSWWQRKE